MAVTGFIGAGGPRPVYFAHATSKAETITVPASVRAGDVLLMTDIGVTSPFGPPATVVPSGFTSISNTTISGIIRTIFSVKRAAGAEAGGSLTGMNGASRNAKLLTVLRGGKPVTTISVQSAAGQTVFNSTPTAQTITASGGTPAILVVASYGMSGSFSPLITTRSLTVGGNSVKVWEQDFFADADEIWHAGMFYKRNDTPSDVVAEMNNTGVTNHLQSCYIELT